MKGDELVGEVDGFAVGEHGEEVDAEVADGLRWMSCRGPPGRE